ncbi:WD repeat-containing protein 90-like [Clytia hemisphaerica]
MPSTAWQQPFVNLCKHYGAGEWTKCSKEGEVSKIMDRTVKSSIFKIIGPIPSANYIQFPKPKGNPLNLIGHYLYVLFKPIDGKYFSIHLDVVTSDSIVIRISLSNIFKEFKSTSTWLQFPVFANPVQGSVDEATTLASNIPDNCLGGSPKSSRWTLLCLNMQYVLSVYLNKQFSHLKSIRLCSSMFLKNVFTSTTKYEPGLDISKARKTGLLASGVVPLPREMSFPLERHETWATKYDHILFPNIENKGLQLENAMPGRSSSKSISKSKSKGKAMVVKEENKERKTSNAQRSRVALAETVQRKLTENKKIASIRLPEVGLETPVTDDSLEISPKPSPDPKKIQQKKPSYHIYANKKPNKSKGKENQPIPITKGKEKQSSRRKVLNVDPILKLSQIIGFDGSTSTKVFWTKDGGNVVYPSHGCIVKYDVTSGRQQFMIGHNEEVTSLCLCETDNNILFSAQRGQNSIIRTWKVQSLKCINIFQTNIADIHCMSVSPNDEFLCMVGLDSHQKQVLAVWDVSSVVKGGAASLIAKVHTELRADTITCVKFIPNDNNRLMTCGKSNMRVWRLKPKQLKSCAIELGQYLDVVFTDMAFERRKKLVEDPTDFKIFVSSSAGKLFVVTYKSLTVTKVFDLSQGKQLSLNCIALSDNYCAVGCSDGYLRVWPISFQSVYLEAEHEGAVNVVSISEDGSKILAGTDMGNLGTIDIIQKSYSTITRSHLSPIISTSLNPVHQQIASISEDRTIKLWDLDTFQQVYDFQSPNEALTSVSCHPNSPELACGFVTGAVRIFSLSTTTLKKELLQHTDTILSTAYSPNGQYLYSAGGDGALIQYNVSDDYDVLKMTENLVCKEPELPSYVLEIDSLGNRGAVIGASSYLITVFSAKTLDELLVIDISCTFKETNQKPTKSSKKNSKTLMDKPIGLIFSPSITGSELLVITMDSRLLKFNSKSGQILTEISNIHKGTPTSFCCCPRGYFIATAGDHCIKVWDYKMEESQVFIGHCSDVSSLAFTNDCRKLISSGEMIAVWDFIPFFKQDNSVNDREVPSQAFPEIQEHSPPGPQPLETSMLPREDQPMPRQPPQLIEQYNNAPPRSVPKLSTMTLLDESQHLENISQLEDDLIDFVIEEKDEKRENQEEDSDCEILCYNNVDKEQKSLHRSARLQHSAPKVLSHFQELRKMSELANKRYAAPTHQAGMRLTEIIGANGNARRNVIWEPDSGKFCSISYCHRGKGSISKSVYKVFPS